MDREEILRRFEAWLDSVLAGEELPQGVTAEILSVLAVDENASANPDAVANSPTDVSTNATRNGSYDQYSMWAVVTGLTQEVKLQGRSFKQLSETLSPLGHLGVRLPEMQREARETARREILDFLLDLRDRLTRGLSAAQASHAKLRESLASKWTARLWARHNVCRQAAETVTALAEGYQMSLERLNEVLAELDVQEIECQGQLFDPSSMHAVDIEETDRAAEGTVVEVYRAGYEWKGKVHRPAQVKVARKPKGSDE